MKTTLINTRKMATRRRLIPAAAAAAVTVTALLLAGCTPAGGANPQESDGSGSGGSTGIKVVVMGGAPDDPYWSTVKNGVDAAAAAVKASGGTVDFVSMPDYQNFNADAAKLVANIAAMDADAAVIPDWVPDAQNENIKALTDAGVDVIFYSAGQDQLEATGASLYVGSENYNAGLAAGEAYVDAGAKNILCVNTLPGTESVEARCNGASDSADKAGAKVTTLNLPTTQFGDPTAITQAIKSAVLQDTSVDAVLTIGVTDSDSAAAAIEQSGRDDVTLASFDVSPSGLERVKAGTQVFSVDQQPFAIGYYALSAAYQLAAYGIALPEDAFFTGPAIINADNVDFALDGAEGGSR